MTDKIQPITMPKWGLAMTEGMVAAWHVAEGDTLQAGGDVLDIETEKITNVYESPVSGVLRRRVATDGDTVSVGALLGVVADLSVSDAEVDAFVDQYQKDLKVVVAAESGAVEPQTIAIGGRSVRYLKLGEDAGASVVLVHGFGGDLNNWLFNQPVLAERRATLSLDLPGHGGSSKSLTAGDVSSLAQAVHEFLDELDIKTLHLVGHSLGGAVTANLALNLPGRVQSLTLICSGGLGPDINMDYINGFIGANRRKELKPVLQMLFADPKLVRRELIDDVLKFKRLDGVETALTTIAEAAFAHGKQAAQLQDELRKLTMPMQVIWGKEDQILPVAHARNLGQTAPSHILEGAGHMVHMEKASEVNRLIEEFIAVTNSP
ncbi:MAG: acetoin dehydrogenase dihydrolipoyllysine-residue acetyltransferase subunit [Gammaproteobacteria bacterium]|nr:acetoin dehydrogenase dihydrolipoyllysine-residue acetyltransferase subunit [Gammaproteobacteria bacterium]